MAVDAEISRQHLRQELALMEEPAAMHHWDVTPDYDRLLVVVTMRAHTGDRYIVEARCDDYKEAPPFFEFIDPEIQANIPHAFSYGPVNPKAFETGKISAELAATLNSSPENLEKQVTLGSRWWAENESDVQPEWDAMLQE